MSDTAYGLPVLVSADGTATPLVRLPLTPAGDTQPTEAWLQKLVFEHPSCLPLAELDSSYVRAIPVCCELPTPAGSIDVLYVTPDGRLVVLEAKLWRNPEARRQVIGQILDYAKELARWTYADLQRQASRATRRSGNVVFEIVAAHDPELEEARFVDAVSRNLEAGRFLLLIVGDGIREGAGAIAEFLSSFGTLDFSFGLVELAIHRLPDDGPLQGATLVQPRVVAKSVTIQRSVVRIEGGSARVDTELPERDALPERTEMAAFYESFWKEFVDDLRLDDPDQRKPRPLPQRSVFMSLPPSGGDAWLTLSVIPPQREAAVSLAMTSGTFADKVFARLREEASTIEAELGVPVAWSSEGGRHRLRASAAFPDFQDASNRDAIKAFLSDRANRFVNVFRPRLARIASEAQR